MEQTPLADGDNPSFVGPLTVFAPALMKLKRRALLAYAVLACEHNRAFERKWVQRVKGGDGCARRT